MWFDSCNTIEDLKKVYKDLVLKHHPDRGGDNATMAQINAEYDRVFVILQKQSTNKTEQAEQVNEYRDLIHQLLNLAGLQIEICGAWLWISGNTYGHKDALKKLGCHFAPVKKLWYWRAENAACYHNHHAKDMEQIRSKYGSAILKAREQEKLQTA